MQVEIFEHSLHLLSNQLSDKLGTCLVLRRAAVGRSLLAHLVETCEITQLTNDCLDALLSWQNSRVSKTSTKACRIRKLLETTHVKTNCSPKSIEKVLQALAEQEEKRRKRKLQEAETKDEASSHAFASFVTLQTC